MALADAGGDAPGEEVGVGLDIGDEREQVALRMVEVALFGVAGHGPRYPAAVRAARARCNRLKSSPAWYEDRVSGEEDTIRKPLPRALRS